MKRIVLFSSPSSDTEIELTKKIFPVGLKNKVVAYVPASGHLSKQKHTDYWKDLAIKNGAEFIVVDNMVSGEEKKIENANILLISGGNTFELLNNLRNSGLDKSIKNFVKKDEFVLSGFSAGAIVLGPRIDIAYQPSGIDPSDLMDENRVGITDLTGLGIIEFEVWPHFYEEYDRATLDKYQNECPHEVVPIRDEEIREIDL